MTADLSSDVAAPNIAAPRPIADSRDPSPRLAALFATRRWLLLLLITVAWTLATIVGISRFGELPRADRLLLVAAAACIVIGWALSRRTAGLWVLIGAPACLVIATAVGGAPGIGWIALPVSASHVAYGLVVLTGRRVGLLAVGIVTLAVIVIWQREPGNVVAGALSVAGGWIAVATLLASALAVWWVWHALVLQAASADAASARLNARTVRELETQERTRALRAAAVTLHETLLSTIRYVLQTPVLDTTALAAYERQHAAHRAEAPERDLAHDIYSSTAARIAADIIRLDPSSTDLPVTEPAREALRAAIVECAMNAVMHGAATEVVVTGRLDATRVYVEITDNGRGLDSDATPGLGWTSVLDEGLGACGGTWSIQRVDDRTVVTISLPRVGTRPLLGRHEDDGFDQGRILITAPLAMTAVVGVAYDAIVAWGSAWGWLFMALVVAATAVGVGAVVRRRRSRPSVSITAIVLLALIPLAMVPLQPDAGQSAVVASAINAAGYGVLAVAVWSRWWAWLLGLGLWAAGTVTLVVVDPQLQALPIVVALVNSLVAVPIVVTVSAIGTRRLAAAAATLERDREVGRREALRASAAVLIDQHLSTCVRQAEAIIGGLSKGAPFDDGTRQELARLEGLIRVTIQVDPISGGGFAQAASQLVTAAFNRGQTVRVGTIIASTDQRPVPRDVITRLDSTLASAASPALRVFTDGVSDYLALEVESTPQSERSTWLIGQDLELTVDSSGAEGWVVMLTRPIEVPAP